MKAGVLEIEKVKHPLRTAKTAVVFDSFEEDWEKGISGDEFVKRAHEHIKEWWRENRENKKA